MKQIILARFSLLLLCSLLISPGLMAQQPAKKEMYEMQKMMQQMKSDPEMQKAMKQFGIDSHTIEKTMSSSSSADKGSYYEFDEFQTPKKNLERINAVPKQPLTSAGLSSYLATAEQCVNASLSPENRKMADLLISTSKLHPDTLANMASGLWMTGNYIPATYLMGKACRLKPNVTNLNNYAAFLVMTGAEELALPVLQKLNRENPKNSTILNNIGQAWFGLGDLDRAESYLDSTTMIFATHSQANQTKCVIQESKGDKSGAIQSMKKSVKGAYTPQKEAMLRKLGYKVEGADLDNSALHMPADPLGFAKWMAIIPPFPKTYNEQMIFAPRWKDFYQEILNERSKLQEKAARLNMEYSDSLVKRQKKFAANLYKNQFKEPYLSARANKVLKYYTDDKDGHNAAKAKQISEEMKFTYDNLEAYKNNAYQKNEQINHKYFDSVGEGQKSPGGDRCKEVISVYNSWVNNANTALETFTADYLKFKARMLEANAYFTQYVTDLQPLIDYNETSMKIAFLVDLSNIKPLLDYQSQFAWACIKNELEEKHEDTHKLANWDDLYCDKNITFYVPGIGSYNFTCNSTTVNLDPLILPFQASFSENLNNGEFTNASGSFKYGPAKVSGEYDFVRQQGAVAGSVSGDVIDEKVGKVPVKAGVGGTVRLEFGKDGLTDFIMEAEGGVEVGNDKVKVSGDANVNWSWNAGGSGEAKGSIDSKALTTAIKAVNFIK